ncbi:hypothetical protein TSUD_28970 [Trifolium subterraneum]|uniref:Retrotransposon gag domain-containing protein n=1 Tax=Trifolium subterraneum TaxID=3900 RepID=A0A2Z6P8A6_TRISU|nr:hypothetical protein TSUD_28970 [Trifolium subterraneum]
MAIGSNTNNDGTNDNTDVVPPLTLNTQDTIIMPADTVDQPALESDLRDGQETSLDSEDDDAVQFLSERKKGKQSMGTPGKSAANPQPNSPRASEVAALVDALRETIKTVNEQITRIKTLEDNQRQILGTSHRRLDLERVQPPPQVQKQNHTPPREDAISRVGKKGKLDAHPEQRSKSPLRRKQLLLGVMTQGSRKDSDHYRGEDSPRREENPTHSPGWSDDEVYKGPLSKQIMDLRLSHALQKPPQLVKIFPTILVEGAMAWYKSLPEGFITSWKDLCKQFANHFTASRRHPKTEASLEAIVQGKNETLRSYIEIFNKEVVQVDTTDDMKKYLLRKNLRDGTKFKEAHDQDRSRHCAYHKSYGHLTEDCIQLKYAIEILIRNGKLKDYVKKKENPRQENREDSPDEEAKPEPPRVKGVAYFVTRPEDLYLISASSGMVVTLSKPRTSSQPYSFYLEELPGGSANSQILLLVRADMTNFDVRRVVVDSGNSCDIMYAHMFRTLQLNESHLTPYVGSDLQGFNGATTKPMAYVDLTVTFGHEETTKSIKVKFLVSYIGAAPNAKKTKTYSKQTEPSTGITANGMSIQRNRSWCRDHPRKRGGHPNRRLRLAEDVGVKEIKIYTDSHGTLPNDEKEAATIEQRSCSYTILDDKLYRRGFPIPLLKCADEVTADYIVCEIHKGINSQHLGGHSLARKVLRAGYHWPTMQQDAKEHVKKSREQSNPARIATKAGQRKGTMGLGAAPRVVGIPNNPSFHYQGDTLPPRARDRSSHLSRSRRTFSPHRSLPLGQARGQLGGTISCSRQDGQQRIPPRNPAREGNPSNVECPKTEIILQLSYFRTMHLRRSSFSPQNNGQSSSTTDVA